MITTSSEVAYQVLRLNAQLLKHGLAIGGTTPVSELDIAWKIAFATTDKALRHQIARAVDWEVLAHLKQVEVWFTEPNPTDSLPCDHPVYTHC